jgi:hypothetical protein
MTSYKVTGYSLLFKVINNPKRFILVTKDEACIKGFEKMNEELKNHIEKKTEIKKADFSAFK